MRERHNSSSLQTKEAYSVLRIVQHNTRTKSISPFADRHREDTKVIVIKQRKDYPKEMKDQVDQKE